MMDPKTTAFLFPGQGSQTLGMGRALAQAFPSARSVFETADRLLGFELSKIAWDGPEEELNDTVNTQPALMVHSIAALQILKEKYPALQPTITAGHSMGELSALVAAGALEFPKALHLVRERGKLMKRAGEYSPGGMAAVLGMGLPDLELICSEASREGETVQVANDNCPGQVVISGSEAALERAVKLAQERGARRARRLAVSIAAHSPLMRHAQVDFNLAVNAAPIADPRIPLVGNVSAQALISASEIRSDLQAQLTSRVRWTETIQAMSARGVVTFIEIGSGNVLIGLLKRISPEAVGINLDKPEDFDQLA